jgi:hypothetical protein
MKTSFEILGFFFICEFHWFLFICEFHLSSFEEFVFFSKCCLSLHDCFVIQEKQEAEEDPNQNYFKCKTLGR